MSYKIAVASEDGIYVNSHFGSASSFLIIDVNEDGTYESTGEVRVVEDSAAVPPFAAVQNSNCGIKKSIVGEVFQTAGSNREKAECGGKTRCEDKGGCGSNSHGHSDSGIIARAETIADCRCLLCKKIGSKAERQLERKAITTFQVDFKIEEALTKITGYYTKLDNHISLRRQ